MTSNQIKSQIETAKTELSELLTRLDSSISEFVELIPSQLEKWMRDTLRSNVRDNSERAQEIGKEGFIAIKEEVDQLIQNLGVAAKDSLPEKSRFPHNLPLDSKFDKSKEFMKFRESFFHERILKDVASLLGPILLKHGLTNNFRGAHPLWKKVGPDLYRYDIHIEKGERLKEVSMNYNEGFRQCLELQKSLESLDLELKRAEAEELFDSA